MFCEKCGRQLPEDAKVCPECENQIDSNIKTEMNNSQEYSFKPETDEKNNALSVGSYLLLMLIMIIPVVNIIMLFIWAFSGGHNLNKRNYARAVLIVMLISLVLTVLAWSTFLAFFTNILNNLGNY